MNINFKLFLKINKIKYNINKGIALCIIAKNENLYINEFVNSYKKLGFKKIFLYDNNHLFGENFYKILKNEITSNFVKIINVRGRSYIQLSSYNHYYHKHLYKYLWLFIY